MRISIIGTAGRDASQRSKMDKKLFDIMVNRTYELLKASFNDFSCLELVSGGAAWADHVAVTLWLMDIGIGSLTLHLPAKWNDDKTQFIDNGEYNWKMNPGRTSNLYHKYFKDITNIDSLQQIDIAMKSGAKSIYYSGFHERNSAVADCDTLIALTFDESSPQSGGTLDTWKKAKKANRIHISLA